jgi:cytochrome c biogenesis protein CcmG/thiol:disulfide interchange protein DsbE
MSEIVVHPPAAPPALRSRIWWQLLVVTGVVALLVTVALQMRRSGPLAAGPVGAGQVAPDFSLSTFTGESVQLADLKGQVVVVNFWASWCLPCEEEAAALENTWRFYQGQGQPVMFLGVDYVDTETEALAYLDRWQITYPNGPDLATRISQAYRIRGVPETFIVDKTGTLVTLKVGPTDEAELRRIIDPLLAEQP